MYVSEGLLIAYVIVWLCGVVCFEEIQGIKSQFL